MPEPTPKRPQRIWLLLLLCAGFFATFLVAATVIRNAVQKTVEQQALNVAEIVANQATTARSVYATSVVDKLQHDGFGSHVHSENLAGYVPIPTQFLKLVGQASSRNSAHLFEYKPVSKWNLDPQQGLGDDFLRWAWPQLEQQDLPNPKAAIDWRPVWRFEQQGEKRVLRYLRADAASQASCVTCHNSYEKTAEIRARRGLQHTLADKQWQQHQLLGALSVTIPLDRVEQVAALQIRETSGLIFGILLASFAAMLWFSWRMVRQERDLQRTGMQLAHAEQQHRTAQDLLEAKQGVERAFSELSTYLHAIGQHALVSVTDPSGRIIEANDKFCQVSGYSRDELIGQDHRVVNSGYHSQAFFAELWATISRGEVWRGEICNRAKSGRLYWVDSAIVPLKDEAGRVQRFISIRIDISEHKRVEQHAVHLATHDALTGLPNRALLQDRIQQALAHDRRGHLQAAVLFIDLDQFKVINDTLGHDVGDLLLVEVARRLRAGVGEEGTVARQGGDEFIILLPEVGGVPQLAVLAQSLLQRLTEPYRVQGETLHISASIGIAVFPDDGNNVETLLKNSDIAMYHAKESGRNNAQFFTASMNQQASERHALLNDLRQALSAGQLHLVYQPIVAVQSGTVMALEVLLRWQHPQRGEIAPSRFIPLAEESGLIVPMGEWVLRSACQQLAQWQAQGLVVPRLAINLSASQFQQRSLLPLLRELLQQTGVEPAGIELEITENILMADTDEVIESLQQLHQLGLKIAIDDFGTGYSSLSYLKRFPLDTLKIDRSFVMDIASASDDANIVIATIALAHSLGMRVVAEGVETEAQLALLRQHGCDLYQGYYFSLPQAAEHVPALLTAQQNSRG